MSDFDRLKKKSIEEIYKKTYIARKYIKALLNKDFSKFDKLKALGFIKILEREYKYDLSDLKNEINEYFKEEKKEIEKIEEKKENNKILFIIFIIFIILLATFYIFYKNKNVQSQNIQPKYNQIKETKPIIIIQDINESKEKNITTDIIKEENVTKKNITVEKDENIEKNITKKVIAPSIKIIPKQKVWIGIKYLDDFSKKSYITEDKIDLNSSKDQLILTGHGYIKIDIDGNITDYNENKKLIFLYKDKKLKKIDEKTYIKYNRGKNW